MCNTWVRNASALVCWFGWGRLCQFFVASPCLLYCLHLFLYCLLTEMFFFHCLIRLNTLFFCSGFTTSQVHPVHVCVCLVPSSVCAWGVVFLCFFRTHIRHVFSMFKDGGDCSSDAKGIPMHSTTKQCLHRSLPVEGCRCRCQEAHGHFRGESIDGYGRWTAGGGLEGVQGRTPTSVGRFLKPKLRRDSFCVTATYRFLYILQVSPAEFVSVLSSSHFEQVRFLERNLMRLPQIWALPNPEDLTHSDTKNIWCFAIEPTFATQVWCWNHSAGKNLKFFAKSVDTCRLWKLHAFAQSFLAFSVGMAWRRTSNSRCPKKILT